MKKIIFYLIVLAGISCQGYAQSFCATTDATPNLLQQIPSARLAAPSNNYVLRIFVHVIRRSNGTGGQSQADVTQGLNTVVADFASHGICVSLLGSDEIWNDTYYNMSSFSRDLNGDGKFDNFSPNSHSNAIDLYLLGPDGNMQSGVAANIGATALALGGFLFGSNLVSSHVLSHELGHCLGLYHTFQGTCGGGCRELVNGSNCTSCGDYVCDTPADPTVFQGNADCSWNGNSCTGSTVDANGQPYNPAMNLIMGYVAPTCMQLFTNGQGERMRTMIANSSLLQGVTVPNTLTVNNVTIGAGVTRLYDVLNYLTAQNVLVNSGGSLTLRAGQDIVLTNGFQAASGSSFHAYMDNACSTIDQPNAARKSITGIPPQQSGNTEISEPGALTADIYPNPVNGVANIIVNAGEARFIEVKAISASGVLLKSMKYPVTVKGAQRIQWDVSGFAQGIYVIQISDGTRVINKKVIKSN
jgi:hypothetical protein